MLKISTIETPDQFRIILEGQLIAPWAAEVSHVWNAVRSKLNGRTALVDVVNLTRIGKEGESALQQLMIDGAHFAYCGVFTKEVLNHLARQCGANPPMSLEPRCTDRY